jgi:hypothetical protein
MTNHPMVWRYMKWCPKKETNCKECAYGCLNIVHDEGRKPVDGNDMLASMNIIVEKGDWEKFKFFVIGFCPVPDLIDWLPMQPARFFDLLEQWLEERNGKRA